jgi:hypothetical protein
VRLDVRAMAAAVGLVWGFFGMFGTGVLNMVAGGYGGRLLEVMSSVYPGYHPDGSVAQLLLGTVYGCVDGGILGALIAWIHNRVAARGPS